MTVNNFSILNSLPGQQQSRINAMNKVKYSALSIICGSPTQLLLQNICMEAKNTIPKVCQRNQQHHMIFGGTLQLFGL